MSTERAIMLVRCPSSSKVKLGAISKALDLTGLGDDADLRGLPVELQSRVDMHVNAQPEGQEETIRYARERLNEMRRQYGATVGLDISIESGAIGGVDVAVVVIRTVEGDETVTLSEGIPFPLRTLEEARRRGFKTVTAGDIIHERLPDIPSNNWQVHFPPHKSRDDQIMEAIVTALRHLTRH